MGAFAMRAAPRLWERISADSKREVLAPRYRPQPALWGDKGLHAAWLGHSTVLLKLEGVTILTDPVFSNRVGLGFGPVTIGLKRIVAPALRHAEFTHPDIVLLSHAHMDHFDLPSLRALESPTTAVVTASGTGDLLRVRNYRAVHELSWGEQAQIGDISIRAFQVNHWGARMQSDTWRGFNGYVIESPRFRILFAGDTAMTGTFRALRTTRPIDLAIMPIGAYNPWIRAHCTPEEAVTMAGHAGADLILPVHHKTFQLSSEPYSEPIERLETALVSSPERLALRDIGEEFSRL